MTVRQEENILIFPIHMEMRIVRKYLEIKCSKKVGTTERSSRMPALSAMDHSYDVSPDLRSDCF